MLRWLISLYHFEFEFLILMENVLLEVSPLKLDFIIRESESIEHQYRYRKQDWYLNKIERPFVKIIV